MKEKNKKRINKLIIPLTTKTLSILSAATIMTTGLVSCKDENKKESSDTTTSISSTSSEDIVSNDIVIGESSIISSSEDILSSEEQSSKDDSSKVGSSNSSTSSSKPSNSTATSSSYKPNNNNNNSSNNNPSSSPTPSAPSTPSTPTMPSSLTAANINDVEVFKHFAEKLRKEVGGGLFIHNDKFIDAEVGAQVTLAVLNQQYLTHETMSNLFSDLSLEEFQSGADFIIVMISQMLTDGKRYSYNNFCLDKNIGNYLVEVQDVFIKNHQQEMAEVLRNFYLKDNTVKYEMHFWVDNYMRRLFNMRIEFNNLKDPELSKAFINSSSSITNYSNKIANIYNNFHNKVKIIN